MGLDPEVRELVGGRASCTPIPHRTPLPPYTETEWDRLVSTCRAIVDDTYGAHKHGLAAANRGTTPTHERWTEGQSELAAGPAGTGRTPGWRNTWGGAERGENAAVSPTRARMFPTLQVVIAYRLLFGSYSGIVPDGIAGLGLEDMDWAEDATILLSYVKRRTAGES